MKPRSLSQRTCQRVIVRWIALLGFLFIVWRHLRKRQKHKHLVKMVMAGMAGIYPDSVYESVRASRRDASSNSSVSPSGFPYPRSSIHG
jgi:hypothetical protein